MEFRALTTLDFAELEKLLAEQRSFFGIPVSDLPSLVDKHSLRRFFVKYLLEGGDVFARGCFQDGELQGFVTGDLLASRRAWIWKLIVIKEELKGTKNPVTNGLCTDGITHAESLGYKRFFSMVPAKFYDIKQPAARWNHVRELLGYRARILEHVPAFTAPRDDHLFKLLYGQQLYPVDTYIRFSSARVRQRQLINTP